MAFPKRIRSSWLNRWNVNHVYLCLVLFTLTLLILSNFDWLPVRWDGYPVQISNVFPLLIRNFQASQLEADLKEPQPTARKCSCTTPAQPKAKSMERHHKPPLVHDYIINEPDKCRVSAPFLILLITVERWQKEARQAIRQTWGKEDFPPGVKLLRLFLLGKDARWTEDAERSLLAESQAYRDIIQQDYLDTYNNLTRKVLMGLNWVATHCPGAAYVMKTDSDMFINTEYLINGLLKPDRPPRLNYFTGHLMNNTQPDRDRTSKWYASPEVYPEDRYPAFCSGTGYVFSAGLARKVFEVSSAVRWLHLEDVYVALCLERLGVQPSAPPKARDFNTVRVPYTDCVYSQIVTSHRFSPGDIISHWNQLQCNKRACALNSTHNPSASH